MNTGYSMTTYQSNFQNTSTLIVYDRHTHRYQFSSQKAYAQALKDLSNLADRPLITSKKNSLTTAESSRLIRSGEGDWLDFNTWHIRQNKEGRQIAAHAIDDMSQEELQFMNSFFNRYGIPFEKVNVTYPDGQRGKGIKVDYELLNLVKELMSKTLEQTKNLIEYDQIDHQYKFSSPQAFRKGLEQTVKFGLRPTIAFPKNAMSTLEDPELTYSGQGDWLDLNTWHLHQNKQNRWIAAHAIDGMSQDELQYMDTFFRHYRISPQKISVTYPDGKKGAGYAVDYELMYLIRKFMSKTFWENKAHTESWQITSYKNKDKQIISYEINGGQALANLVDFNRSVFSPMRYGGNGKSVHAVFSVENPNNAGHTTRFENYLKQIGLFHRIENHSPFTPSIEIGKESGFVTKLKRLLPPALARFLNTQQRGRTDR